eukprot:jgi/Ulvmu1/916/UM101_0025.1
MTRLWSPEIARAVAQHTSMPGLAGRQSQFVRYEGLHESKLSENGWVQADSLSAQSHMQAASNTAEATPAASPADLPQQVQLQIVEAPAEFCLPLKSDRQFKPQFQVEVRVMNGGHMRLPLRVKAFAAFQDDLSENACEWLPPELRPQPQPPALCTAAAAAAAASLELKGPRVSSYVFQSPYYNHARDGSDGSTGAQQDGVGHGPAVPCFPSRCPRARAPQPPLRDVESMWPRDDDPDLATPIDLGSVNNTFVARYDFKGLEFAHPTRMCPVQLIFACLIGGRDLLYAVYQVPTISICRSDQRMKALDRLAMPRAVYADIEEFRDRSALSGRSAADSAAPARSSILAAAVPVDRAGAARTQFDSQMQDAAEQASNNTTRPVGSRRNSLSLPTKRALVDRGDGDAATNIARPLLRVPPPEHALDDTTDTGALPGLGTFSEETRSPRSRCGGLLAGGTADMEHCTRSTIEAWRGGSLESGDLADRLFDDPAAMQHVLSQEFLRQTVFDDSETDVCALQGLFNAPAASSPCHSQRPAASADMHVQAAASSAALTAAAPQPHDVEAHSSGVAEAVAALAHGFPSSGTQRGTQSAPHGDGCECEPPLRRHCSDVPPFMADVTLPLQSFSSLPWGGGGSAPQTQPQTQTQTKQWRATSRGGSPSRTDTGSDTRPVGSSGTCQISAHAVGGAVYGHSHVEEVRRVMNSVPAMPPPVPPRPKAPEGMTQEDVYSFISSVYEASGLQRPLQREDHKALLSLAGFPPLAGFDEDSRVSRRQFAAFKTQLLAVLRLLRTISTLWDRTDPCIISGFDMDRTKAVAVLATQPVGTFICRFSMLNPGSMILSCKVSPETIGVQEGHVVHLTVSPSDMDRARVSQLILSLPLATHLLDAHADHRVDKRTLLDGGCISLESAFGLLSGHAGTAAGGN